MSGTLPAWAAGRQQASYRGIPFTIAQNNKKRGRQVALHTYPMRDDPWPEDLGRSPRITSIRGQLNGDNVDLQIAALDLAVELPGAGQLVHPTLGTLMVSVLGYASSDSVDAGRTAFFEMSVVPSLDRIYPVITADTQGQTQNLLQRVSASVASDFAAVQSEVSKIRAQVTSVTQTVQGYVSQAQGLVNNATALAHFPAGLIGNNGRFAGGSRAPNLPGYTTLALASSAVNGALSNVSSISGTLAALAAKI